jgi:hypothetical protein
LELLGAGDSAERSARPPDYGGFSFDDSITRPSRAELRATHMALRDLLDAFVSNSYRNIPKLQFLISVGERHGYVNPAVFGGRVRDRCVLAVLILLTGVGPQRVKACPECKAAFIKTGRRRYCRRVECERKRNAEYWKSVRHKYRGKATKTAIESSVSTRRRHEKTRKSQRKRR